MSSTPRRPDRNVAVYAYTVGALGAATLIFALFQAVGDSADPIRVVAAAATIVAVQRGIWIGRFRQVRTETLSHDELIVPIILFLVGPAGSVLAWGLGSAGAELLFRRAPVKAVYNIGQYVIAAAVAGTVARLGGAGAVGAEGIWVTMLSVAAFSLTLVFLFGGLIARLEGSRWLVGANRLLGEDALRISVEVLLGVTLAVAVVRTPALLPIAAATAVAVMVLYRRWLRRGRQRELLADVLVASTSIHHASDPASAEAALVEAAHTLVGVQGRVGEKPVTAREDHSFSLPSPSGAERFFVLPARTPPLDRHEVRVVETLVDVARVTVTNFALLEARRHSEARLEELLEARQEFLTAFAHAVRTPLAAINGFANLLAAGGFEGPEHIEAERHVAEQASAMAVLVDNLLLATRAGTGQIMLAPEPVDLAGEVERAAGWFYDASDFSVTALRPVRVRADPVRVRHLIRNLVLNAHQRGGRRVEVSVVAEDLGARITFRDDGVAIPGGLPDMAAMPLTHTEESAVVFGLVVARILAELMGGRLEHHNEGNCTVFELTLPTSVSGPPVAAGANRAT